MGPDLSKRSLGLLKSYRYLSEMAYDLAVARIGLEIVRLGLRVVKSGWDRSEERCTLGGTYRRNAV